MWRSLVLCLVLGMAHAVEAAPPEVRDPRYTLQLVAENPDIVTPIGAAFDHKGRLLVIESHTHFPPKDYPGPKGDRIRIVEDTTGDGKADRFRTFFEGTQATMSLITGPDGWMYVATRMKVFRIRDTNNDDVADETQEIAFLETKGNYPHNGLSGLTFDLEGRLLFGLGENLGEPYRLIGSDKRVLSGGGEGGNIYRCQADGSKLEHLSTGLWNPFGICVDPVGRIFTVENDPDATPPCRLLHVVKGSDFGFQFRYGRAGRHPLQAWDGELPGTLPMVAGTGEAPCDVLPYDGQIWVTSWGDYRIERFSLKSVGASVRAERDIVVQGDDQFRPVDFAVAPDGSLYFTDWVSKSYPVHQQGRIWRLARKEKPTNENWLGLSAAERSAETNRQAVNLDALRDADAFAHQAAVVGLALKGQPSQLDWASFVDSRVRLGVLEAVRMAGGFASDRDRLLKLALKDVSAEVRLFAVRWIADDKAIDFRAALDQQLTDSVNSVALFQASLAAIEWLDSGKVRSLPKNATRDEYLIAALANSKTPAGIQSMALRVLPPSLLKLDQLAGLTKSVDATLRREAVRSLGTSSDQGRIAMLTAIVSDEAIDAQTRADAISALSNDPESRAKIVTTMTKSANEVLRTSAQRVLASGQKPDPAGRPVATEIAAWNQRLSKPGDANAGWRVFFGSSATRCANCHAFEGRGASVGPDLTLVVGRLDRTRLLESILQPSREIAPRFLPWMLELKDGRTLVAQSLGLTEDAKSERFLGHDGRSIEILLSDIESRQASKISIMPAGIEATLSDDELRDLLALLAPTAK